MTPDFGGLSTKLALLPQVYNSVGMSWQENLLGD